MTDYQVGWYVWLLVESWKARGTLPNDPAILFKLSRAESRELFDKEKEAVLCEFDDVADSDRPLLVHRRMSMLWKEKFASWEKTKAAAKMSVESRNRKRGTAIPAEAAGSKVN